MSEQPSVVLFSFYGSPPLIDSLAADPEETKNIAGRNSPPHSDPFNDAGSRLAGLLDLSRTGLQLKRFLTSLFARARAAGRNGIRLSTFPNNKSSMVQPPDDGASARLAINLPVFVCES